MSAKSQAIWLLLEARGEAFKQIAAELERGEMYLGQMQGFDMLTHAINHVAQGGDVIPLDLAEQKARALAREIQRERERRA